MKQLENNTRNKNFNLKDYERLGALGRSHLGEACKRAPFHITAGELLLIADYSTDLFAFDYHSLRSMQPHLADQQVAQVEDVRK